MTAVPDDNEAPLVLEGVSKAYGDFVAVDQVSLRIEPGEIFALLGPNGAGKTTLISCITGLARATGGQIRVFGHDVVRQFRAARRLVGLVPQEISFDPFFTPRESLLNQMGFMGCRADPEWADHLLRTFALFEHRNAYTRSLSGGMKRRLLVAKALVHRPRLLFLDEPTAGVDVKLRQDLWTEVQRLRDEGTTIILTTHYLEEAEQLADRIGMIRAGQLFLVERTGDLMARNRHGSEVVLRLERDLQRVPDGVPGRMTGDRELVASWGSPADLERILAAVRAKSAIHSLEVRQTNLEDIFLEMMEADAPPARATPGEQA